VSTPFSPTDLARKQNDLLRELKQPGGGFSQVNLHGPGLTSDDKLSYSQTININNLKSVENLENAPSHIKLSKDLM